jgi:xanthine dehydrogenase accessory factor
MKVLIKGAGDLATGIAYRLYKAGYDILMTEIAIPTTVRRIVAFSRAVYEKEAVIEGVRGVLVHTIEEVEKAHAEGAIPIIVDEKAAIRDIYAPEVVIDAIIAKVNLGTTMEEAPLVIGVGPGFTAGKDCRGVIETKRGHYLGKVIREGSAIPNTGIPGNVGGYTIERIIRASADGDFQPVADIGDLVEKDQIIAISGGQPVYALMSGIVRGMLQAGVKVKEGMKCGDIDARCERNHCFTISDKARSIGGGVLEAVVAYEHGKF